MWVLVVAIMTSSSQGGTSSSIATIGNFSSELACLTAAVAFLGDHVGSIGHGADFVKDAHCLSLAEEPKKR